MIQYPLHGSYSPSQMIMVGAFQLDDVNHPSVYRDGTKVASSKKMFTVERVAMGRFRVHFNDNVRVPVLPFIQADLHQAVAPTVKADVHVVKGSWDAAGKTFDVQVLNDADQTITDADVGDMVVFVMIGAIDSVGVDPA